MGGGGGGRNPGFTPFQTKGDKPQEDPPSKRTGNGKKKKRTPTGKQTPGYNGSQKSPTGQKKQKLKVTPAVKKKKTPQVMWYKIVTLFFGGGLFPRVKKYRGHTFPKNVSSTAGGNPSMVFFFLSRGGGTPQVASPQEGPTKHKMGGGNHSPLKNFAQLDPQKKTKTAGGGGFCFGQYYNHPKQKTKKREKGPPPKTKKKGGPTLFPNPPPYKKVVSKPGAPKVWGN